MAEGERDELLASLRSKNPRFSALEDSLLSSTGNSRFLTPSQFKSLTSFFVHLVLCGVFWTKFELSVGLTPHTAFSRQKRRERDSNSRYPFGYTTFPGWPIRPLWHPSAFDGIATFTNHYTSTSCFLTRYAPQRVLPFLYSQTNTMRTLQTCATLNLKPLTFNSYGPIHKE